MNLHCNCGFRINPNEYKQVQYWSSVLESVPVTLTEEEVDGKKKIRTPQKTTTSRNVYIFRDFLSYR